MIDKQKQLNEILTIIAKEISISEQMIDTAVRSYGSVGRWLTDGIDFNVFVYPQGSMSLGTTIKPISDADDYDIDLVCMLEDGNQLDARSIKNIVGDRLKENEVYRKKIEIEGEGKRCWKMKYEAFHMDILPCVPKNIYLEPNYTEIRLTNKISESMYEDKYSNPYGYRKWFENRISDVLTKEKRNYAKINNVDIEDVPTFKVKTPLQMAIQLLKRHRDICFQSIPDIAPISIIITTLASKAYNGEDNLYEALSNIIMHMSDFIEIRNGEYWIQNPVMSQENFADKWQQDKELKNAFFRWILKVRYDLINKPLEVSGLDELGLLFKEVLGNKPVERAFKRYAEEVLESRNSGKLYTAGLTVGLSKDKINDCSVKIEKHNFYGSKLH